MRILLLTLCLCVAFSAGAQTYKQYVKFADKNWDAGDYYSASLYYKKALDIDSLDINVLWRYAECLRLYNDYEKAEAAYSKVHYREETKIFPLSLYYLASMQKYNGKYKEAQKNFKMVNKQFSRNKKSFEYLKSKQEMQSCSFAMKANKKDTSGFKIYNAGEKVNTTDSEFGSAWVDSVLYYASLRADNVKGDLEIHDPHYKIKVYKNPRNGSAFSTSQALDTTINSILSHNANGCYSSDGSRFYFTRCIGTECKIMYSEIRNGKYGTPKEANGGVNKEGYTSTQPMIAKIGERDILFFVSNMPNGEGKLDIWSSEITGKGDHTKPRNAGKTINSIDDEITPFYDSEEGALYFSSTWHDGFGGFDIFRSNGTPEKFGAAQNLGFPLNTQWNDMYYSVYPSEYVGFLTSNRKGSLFVKSPTCCNDIYLVEFPRKEIPQDTIPYKSLEDLNKYLPVTLYFHNDEPNPRSNDTTTKLNYMTTYNAYTAMIDKYKEEYSKGLAADKAIKAQDDIENFFIDYVDKGVSDLAIFTRLLLAELEKGQKIELSIKGFASPLAKTDYNVHLTKRRIQSLINFLREYEGGVFIPYLEGTAPNGGQLFFVKIPFGEYSASNVVSDNFHDTRNSVYSRSAALERKIEVQTVQRANKDSIQGEMRVNKESHDFGAAKSGSTLKTTFTVKNTGKGELKIENIMIGCDCISVEYSREPIPPGGSAEIVVTFNTTGYTGKNVRSVTLVTNGFPANKRLVVTAELMSQ